MGDSELVKAIVHYQQCLEKYTRRNNEPRMLYCISKLFKMPITVEHLEQTGVGRTVNSLRKVSGEVGDAAKSLVAKWKEMVVGEDEPKDSPIKPESSKSHKEESKDKKLKERSGSSHKESDKKSKYDSREKSTSSLPSRNESHSKKREKEELQHRKEYEENSTKDKESKNCKSSKRKEPDDDSSDTEESVYEKQSNHHKHRESKQKSEEDEKGDSSEYDYYHKAKKDKRDSSKRDSLKRKHDDSDYDNENNEVSTKHRRYSEYEESVSESDEIEAKKHSHKHQSKHKNEGREKSRHSSKHKEKRDKKESEGKAKKETDDYRVKDKHSDDFKVKAKHSNKSKRKSDSEKREKNDKDTNRKSKHDSSQSHSKHKSKSSSHSNKAGASLSENGIGSGSGASFAEALGMLVPSSSKTNKKKVAVIHPLRSEKSTNNDRLSLDDLKAEIPNLLLDKKTEPVEINVTNLLPEITPNYRPLGNLIDNGQSKNKITAEDEALIAIMNSKISRTKVYSGNKVIWGRVSTLFELCTRVLQDNIDALEYTGGVPYNILKPVIERANPDQLFMLEHHNPYLIEDTDELWQLHCQREFRTKKREEMETWRDMYMRCLDEREAKLRALTANIKQSQDKSLPVRQTKLAYVDSVVKPPRAVARKQAKHGTAAVAAVDKKPLITPSSRLSTLATAGAAGQIAVPNPGARAASATGHSSAALKVKKAPLMQKTLALMKNRCFRR